MHLNVVKNKAIQTVAFLKWGISIGVLYLVVFVIPVTYSLSGKISENSRPFVGESEVSISSKNQKLENQKINTDENGEFKFKMKTNLFGWVLNKFQKPEICSVENNKEIKGCTATKGIQGEKGEQGKDGQNGLVGVAGKQGESGVNGKDGQNGVDGLQGDQGLTGKSGIDGLAGKNGIDGQNGAQGIQGSQGVAGATDSQGIQGIQGLTGLTGATGAQGIQGIQGLTGATGATGSQGIQGLTGATGAQGLQGATGAQGLQGLIGLTGAQGLQGLTGATGLQGIQGLTGLTGAQGIQGLQGIQGAKGDTGNQGIQGLIGLTGATGAQGLQGIQGVQGIAGIANIQTADNGLTLNGSNLQLGGALIQDTSIDGASAYRFDINNLTNFGVTTSGLTNITSPNISLGSSSNTFNTFDSNQIAIGDGNSLTNYNQFVTGTSNTLIGNNIFTTGLNNNYSNLQPGTNQLFTLGFDNNSTSGNNIRDSFVIGGANEFASSSDTSDNYIFGFKNNLQALNSWVFGRDNTIKDAPSSNNFIFGNNNLAYGVNTFSIGQNLSTENSDLIDIGLSNGTKTTIDTSGRLTLRGAFSPNSNDGLSGQVLTSQGFGLAPIWTNLPVAGITSSSNGLTRIGVDVKLGGVLTENTSIIQANNSLALSGGSFSSKVNTQFGGYTTGFSNGAGILNHPFMDSAVGMYYADSGSYGTANSLVINSIYDNQFDISTTDNVNSRHASIWGNYDGNLLLSTSKYNEKVNVHLSSTQNPNSFYVDVVQNTPYLGTRLLQTRNSLSFNRSDGSGFNPVFDVSNQGDVRFNRSLNPNGLSGTTGQVLTSQGSGSVPIWTTPSGGGACSTCFENGGNSFGGFATIGTNDAQNLAFETAGLERMRLDQSGRLGIGTTTPNNKLEISQGTSGNSGLRFTNLTSGNTAGVAGTKVLSVNASGDVVLVNDANSAAMTASNGLTAASGDVKLGGSLSAATSINLNSFNLNFDGTGNVGIGSVGTPTNKLHVLGSVRATSGFQGNTGTAGSPTFYFTGNTNTGVFSPATDQIGFSTGGVNRLTIGNTSLNITPTSVPNTADSTLVPLCINPTTGNVLRGIAATSCNTSSARYKTGVESLDADSLNKVLALRPVSYQYKDNTSKTAYGFIAEEAAKVDNNLAVYKDGLVEGVNDTYFTSLAIKAIQEQQKQIDGLKPQGFEQLKNDVEQLKQNTLTASTGLTEGQKLILGNFEFENGVLTIKSSLQVQGDLGVSGKIVVGADTAFNAKIAAGQTKTIVTFDKPYEKLPIINITPNGLIKGNYAIQNKTNNSFEIVLEQAQEKDTTFDVIVLGK
jgi:hypothetical protein